MKRMIVIVTIMTWLGMGNIVSAKELLPWETENIKITTPGVYSVKIDDRQIFFEVPADLDFSAGRALEVITRGEKFENWQKKNGEYKKGCFGMSKDFYSFGIPLFGSYAQFSISAELHVKASVKRRAYRGREGVDLDPSYFDYDRGDFSKPEDLRANMERRRGDVNRSTPVEEVIINNRKWYHYYENHSSIFYPDVLREHYITGLAPDRYLKITIRQYPVPVAPNRYPIYPTDDQQPSWMKKTTKYKEQVISSVRITTPENSNEPDLYEEGASPHPTESPQKDQQPPAKWLGIDSTNDELIQR